MASGSIGLTSNQPGYVSGRIDWQSYTNNKENYSDVSAQVYVVLNAWGIQGTGWGEWNENGNLANTFSPYVNIAWGGYGTVQVFEKSGIRVNHNDNGDASINLGCKMQFGFAGVSNIGGSGWCTMDHIPRYATSNISERGKSINTISINWTSDVPTDYRKYSINGGSWKDAEDTVASNNKSGYFTISDLEPNTSYKIKLRVRRTDSQLWSESNTITIITYNYATITEAPDIIIGENATIEYNNPSGASTQVHIESASGDLLTSKEDVTDGKYTFEFTESQIQNMYNLIPDSTKLNVKYYITTTQNGKTYTHYLEKVFSINVEECKPTLDLDVYEPLRIKDTNDITIELTKDTSVLIKSYSDANITLFEDAIPKNSAKIIKYIFTDGDSTAEVDADEYNSPEDSVTISKISRDYIDITAVDSRGLSVTESFNVSLTNYFNEYTKPEIYASDTSLKRINGVTSSLEFKFSGKYYSTALGEIGGIVIDPESGQSIVDYNGEWNIPTLKYKKIPDSSNNWDSAEWIIIPNSKYSGTVEAGNVGSGELKNIENAILTDFTVGTAYKIKIRLEDLLDYTEIILTISSGEPIMAWNKSKKIVGVGKIPDKTLPKGSIDVLDKVKSNSIDTSTINTDSINANEIKLQDKEILTYDLVSDDKYILSGTKFIDASGVKLGNLILSEILKTNILWTNLSPESGMAANTNINLSSSDYDFLIWIFTYTGSSSDNEEIGICMKGKNALLSTTGYTTNSTVRRVIDYVNDTRYRARIAYLNSDTNSNYAIPLYAIGIKFTN